AFIKKDSILTQRIVAHIMNPTPRIMITATIPQNIDKQKYIIVDTINQLENKGIFSSKFILGLLNSNLISWYSYRFIFANAIRTMQFDNPTTEKIPFPNILLNTAEDQLKHDNIAKLVEQMLAAKEKLSKAKLDAEVNKLEMQIASLDRQIDQSVYELYGLTEEEIRIVEGDPSTPVLKHLRFPRGSLRDRMTVLSTIP
ncbi:MAG: hypothetical protein Q7U68_07690, partial [Candidatus Roizmanbacteria bacterium]|nr:hypothetical protein [Candidatus Roizmanbacteria bacterium]